MAKNNESRNERKDDGRRSPSISNLVRASAVGDSRAPVVKREEK